MVNTREHPLHVFVQMTLVVLTQVAQMLLFTSGLEINVWQLMPNIKKDLSEQFIGLKVKFTQEAKTVESSLSATKTLSQ